MGNASDINHHIIEGLYEDALVLADEVRGAFELSPPADRNSPPDLSRVAISVEGLRTTTRVMHILAWLLNHRAFFAGELNEFQLRRFGVLPVDRPADLEQLPMLPPETRKLIDATMRLHSRVTRLDNAWRARFVMEPPAIARLQERLGRAVAGV